VHVSSHVGREVADSTRSTDGVLYPQPGETPARAAGAPQGPVAWSPMVVPSLVCVVREGRWSRIFNFPRGVSCMWGGWCFPGAPGPP